MVGTLLHIREQLWDLTTPRVMGILNLTEDSFYTHCSSCTEAQILSQAARMWDEGADGLDVGACSTRPGSTPVSEEEESARISLAIRTLRAAYPDRILSVDTFRVKVAEQAIAWGADMINDVSGGQEGMYELIAQARVPYILTHTRGDSRTMVSLCDYDDMMVEVVDYLARRVDILHRQGVADVIIDPGFGFAKTVEQNFHLLSHLDQLQIVQAPILVGISRKSMIYKPLHTDPQHALAGTIALHMEALNRGASILRVHDVREAKDTIKMWEMLQNNL